MGAVVWAVLSVVSLVAPLTGQAVPDEAVLARPVLAVKIDNAPPARPHTGLNEADVVFEELVEGGITRFAALYHSTLPPLVGPVRSAREVDADLLRPFNPLVVISGAAPGPILLLQRSGLRIVKEHEWAGFVRTAALAPHNLYVRPAELLSARDGLPAAVPWWTIDTAAPSGGTPRPRLTVPFSSRASATWDWDGQARVWVRSQDGAPHDLADGARVTAENVLVAIGAPAAVEGTGVLLRDGHEYELRWRKPALDQPFQWLTPDGAVLPVAPGRTWVELPPLGATLSG